MKNICVIIVLSFCVGACEKDVQIDIPTAREHPLFIEGMLFPGEHPKIYVSRSNPFFSSDVAPQQVFARGAELKITEGNTTYPLRADSVFNQFRCRWVPFYTGDLLPDRGKTYVLELNYNGRTYMASTTLNQKKVDIESIEYTPEFFDVYGGHDGVIIRIKDPTGMGDAYRFQMDRNIDNSVLHAHALDGIVNTCTQEGELFPVRDIGRVVYTDKTADGQTIEMFIEVTYEYSEGDSAWVYMQSVDPASAAFYRDLDEQLVAILNPFVEPVFIDTQIDGAVGVFGSAMLSDPVLFIYPQDNP